MIPLCVTARIDGAVALPYGPIALDGLLAATIALRDQLPPPGIEELVPIEIPIQKEPGGRFHLASFSSCEIEAYEQRWVNRKFPIAEAQALGEEKFRRIRISAGPQKSYRLPLETSHVRDDTLTWWCVGDATRVRELLDLVSHVGKKRATGLGRVREWRVAPCEPWGEGFPILREGRPMRTLPVDYPGLETKSVIPRYAVLTYPYWRHEAEELCAVVSG